jgi:hypothetical protein
MKRGFVSAMPCYYLMGNVMPWPPMLPGSDNWATGDMPTLLAYVEAIGSRVLKLEEELGKIATDVASLRRDMQVVYEQELPEVVALKDRIEKMGSAIRELDARTVGSIRIGRGP